MKEVNLTAEPREAKGTGPVGRLRKKGFIPAIVYGSGKPTRLIQLNAHDFEHALRGHFGEHMLMNLEVSGDKPVKVLMKETQYHPVSGKIIHVDFNEILMTRKLRVEVPIKLVGEPEGVTQQGGILEHILRAIEIECLPKDILNHVDLDVSKLLIGHSLSIAEIHLDPAKYTVISSPDLAVAAVSAPKVEEEVVVPEAAVEGAIEEPEVLREKKVEGEEGEEGEEGKKEGKKEGKAEGKKEAGKPEGKKEGKPEAKKEGKPEAKEEGKKAK